MGGIVCPPALQTILLWLFLGFGAFLLILFSYFEGFPVALFTLGCFLLGVWKREYLFYVLLLQLPFWGKSPEYWQAPLLDINILVLLMLECGAILSRGSARRAHTEPAVPLVGLLVLVAIIGVLPSLPDLWALARSQGAYQTYGMTLFAHPGFRFNVVRKLLSLVLCVGTFLYVRRQDAAFERRAVRVIIVAALLSLGIGWLRFFGLFERPSFLTFFVSTYSWKLANSPIRQFSSSFTNPMWYAEYLLLALPFLLVRALRERGGRLFLILSFVCIVSLGLTIERTAWVASAAALLIVVAFAVVEARRRRVSAKALKLLAVLVVSLAVLAVVLFLSLPSEVSFHKVRNFASSPRTYLWRTVLPVIGEAPWLGHGIGSFMLAYEEQLPAKALPLHHQTAHNTYLHMATEMGIPWTLLFACLSIYAVVRGMRRPSDSLDPRASSMGVLVMIALVGLSVYIFFIRAVELLFWVCLGLALRAAGDCDATPGEEHAERPVRSLLPRHVLLVFVGIWVAVAVVGAVRFWPQARGFYGWEAGADGAAFRWSRPTAALCVPVRGNTVRMLLAVGHPDAGPQNPVLLQLRVEGRSVRTYEFDHPGGYEITYTLTPQERQRGRIRIGWKLDRGWMWGSWPVDERVLGVQLRSVAWE